MISFSVSNNFTWVSADARPSCVFWRGCRHDSINKSDPHGAADVFLISLCSTIESRNWLSLQHLPNSEVCVFAALQKKKSLQTNWSRRLRIDFRFEELVLVELLLSSSQKFVLEDLMIASLYFKVCSKVLSRAQRFMEEVFPKEPSWDPQHVLTVLWRTSFRWSSNLGWENWWFFYLLIPELGTFSFHLDIYSTFNS